MYLNSQYSQKNIITILVHLDQKFHSPHLLDIKHIILVCLCHIYKTKILINILFIMF